MSVWCPPISKARKAKINAAIARDIRDEQRAQYREYAAEQRACGYEVPSFSEWLGESSSKDDALFRLRADERYYDGEEE